MILISSINYEPSTSKVAEWLLFFSKEFTIITETNVISKLIIVQSNENSGDIEIKTSNEQEFNYDNIDAIWYRKGDLLLKIEPTINVSYFSNNTKDEWSVVKDFIMLNFRCKTILGSYSKGDINKLQVLKIAKEIGLNIPDTIVCTDRISLIKKINKKRIINKHISNIINVNFKNKLYLARTNEIDIKTLPQSFFPSLFQNLIEKKYELRIFFLKNTFYPMAIFSQADKKTDVDFRNYNYEKPNRNVPFILPQSIKAKLKNLMKKLKLNTGSIDMIVTPNDEYIFLEVNPVGQFGMVSYPCNYFLEREIAIYLSKSHE
jgi:ATP-GRASP peptide maturase of grasp-with-spasm system